ncbi:MULTISPECIES: hypothetical protein [unclassified Chryseobacterium]|uniref:hypothetical protein n=1 Tax=unclassified Chryseobacterium TaxID=2593645 RepID=UPI00115B6445|nr:hypothetical protein [Chryseobacterium sp. ON_d1]GEJ47349.1 hypothetical protein CRS_39570 [Chryseobacterium sp. ON_d1]
MNNFENPDLQVPASKAIEKESCSLKRILSEIPSNDIKDVTGMNTHSLWAKNGVKRYHDKH